jgi:hypothetical protein
VWFEYGSTTSYGLVIPQFKYATIGSTDVTANISNLAGNTTYHFRLVTQNLDGLFCSADDTLHTLIQPEVVVSDLDGPAWLAAKDDNLYWLERYGISTTSGAIRQCSKNGPPIVTLTSGFFPSSVLGIVLDGSYIYYFQHYAGGSVFLKRIDVVNGGAVVDIEDLTTPSTSIPGWSMQCNNGELFLGRASNGHQL